MEKGKQSAGGDQGGDKAAPAADTDKEGKGKAQLSDGNSDLASNRRNYAKFKGPESLETLVLGGNGGEGGMQESDYRGDWTTVRRRGQRDGGSKVQGRTLNVQANRASSVSHQKTGDMPMVKRGLDAARIGRRLVPQQMNTSGTSVVNKSIQPVSWRDVCAGVGEGINGDDNGCAVPEFNPTLYNGIHAADIQQKDIDDSATFWENTLVGFVMGGAPYYTQIKRYIDFVWMPKCEVEVITKSNGYFFCKFSDRREMERIQRGDPWMFNGRFMIIKEWNEDIELEQYVLSSMPVWIRLPNLPSVLWELNCLGRIGSLIGKPIRLDVSTEKKRRLDYARLLVEINANRDFPKEVYVKMPSGKLYKQPVIYEYLPERCKGCISLGHTLLNCPNIGMPCWRPVQNNDVSCSSNSAKPIITEDNRSVVNGVHDNVSEPTNNSLHDINMPQVDPSGIKEVVMVESIELDTVNAISEQVGEETKTTSQVEVITNTDQRVKEVEMQDQNKSNQTEDMAGELQTSTLINISDQNEKIIPTLTHKTQYPQVSLRENQGISKERQDELQQVDSEDAQVEMEQNQANHNKSEGEKSKTLVELNAEWTRKLRELQKEGTSNENIEVYESKSKRDMSRLGRRPYHPYK